MYCLRRSKQHKTGSVVVPGLQSPRGGHSTRMRGAYRPRGLEHPRLGHSLPAFQPTPSVVLQPFGPSPPSEGDRSPTGTIFAAPFCVHSPRDRPGRPFWGALACRFRTTRVVMLYALSIPSPPCWITGSLRGSESGRSRRCRCWRWSKWCNSPPCRADPTWRSSCPPARQSGRA